MEEGRKGEARGRAKFEDGRWDRVFPKRKSNSHQRTDHR